MKLVEEMSGIGELRAAEQVFPGVAYRIRRFQGFSTSQLPIPGLHRIEGSVEVAELPAELVGRDVKLKLADGRSLALTIASADGRVLAEGHGPKHGCGCC